MSHNSTIKAKIGKCCESDCNYNGQIIAGRCPTHYQKHRAEVCKERAEKRGKSVLIPKQSEKEIARQIEYAKERKKWLPEHELCEAGLRGCEKYANQIHHRGGRLGDLLLDKSNWLAVCYPCHQQITENSAQAIELNLSERRNT